MTNDDITKLMLAEIRRELLSARLRIEREDHQCLECGIWMSGTNEVCRECNDALIRAQLEDYRLDDPRHIPGSSK